MSDPNDYLIIQENKSTGEKDVYFSTKYVGELNARIKQLNFDCDDFGEAAKIALEDRDKQVIKVKQLEDVNGKLDDILNSINNWCKAYPKKNFIGKEFDLANHVLDGIQKLIDEKALERDR